MVSYYKWKYLIGIGKREGEGIWISEILILFLF